MSAAVALPVLGRLTVHWCGAGGPTCGSSRCRFAGGLSSLVVEDINLHAANLALEGPKAGLAFRYGRRTSQYLMGYPCFESELTKSNEAVRSATLSHPRGDKQTC